MEWWWGRDGEGFRRCWGVLRLLLVSKHGGKVWRWWFPWWLLWWGCGIVVAWPWWWFSRQFSEESANFLIVDCLCISKDLYFLFQSSDVLVLSFDLLLQLENFVFCISKFLLMVLSYRPNFL